MIPIFALYCYYASVVEGPKQILADHANICLAAFQPETRSRKMFSMNSCEITVFISSQIFSKHGATGAVPTPKRRQAEFA